jgi:hypothetical protein
MSTVYILSVNEVRRTFYSLFHFKNCRVFASLYEGLVILNITEETRSQIVSTITGDSNNTTEYLTNISLSC